jgi:hypothetical protein
MGGEGAAAESQAPFARTYEETAVYSRQATCAHYLFNPDRGV